MGVAHVMGHTHKTSLFWFSRDIHAPCASPRFDATVQIREERGTWPTAPKPSKPRDHENALETARLLSDELGTTRANTTAPADGDSRGECVPALGDDDGRGGVQREWLGSVKWLMETVSAVELVSAQRILDGKRRHRDAARGSCHGK